jgi:asparagine synthase (glutamine-hydrolysing)
VPFIFYLPKLLELIKKLQRFSGKLHKAAKGICSNSAEKRMDASFQALSCEARLMCGISGFNWGDAGLIERMNKSLAHRGPDDQGIYVDERLSLGHRRLSIIDLSAAGRQPMSNEDGSIWIVFNGEIYNFCELRKDLESFGHIFRSNSDTEVIIHAYEEWGYNCVERFNGMWGFAIYDKDKELIFLSRDRFGVKPLYYYFDNKLIIFSSEINGILQHEIRRAPNDRTLYEYMAFDLVDHSRETFFKGIYSLMPGESLIYDLVNGSMDLKRWYRLEVKIKALPTSRKDNLSERVRDLFMDGVRYRLVADVPVGSCLSGGIDSSSIVCAMRRLAGASSIKTFSLVFPGEPIDESAYIDEVASNTNVESYRTTLTLENVMEDLKDLIRSQGEPFGSLSIYGQYKIMQLAHQNGMKVLLDGQGGDELFAGYTKYRDCYLMDCLRSLRLREFVRHLNAGFLRFLAIGMLGRTGLTRRLLVHLVKRKTGFLQNFYDGDLDSLLFEWGSDLNHHLQKEITTYSIPHLLRYEDRNSMRWSIESRLPFMDYRLVELAASLPSHQKIKEGETKHILRKAMEGLVPKRILERRDKIGFATPDELWFREPSFVELMSSILDSEEFRSRPYWKYAAVKRLFEDHLQRKRDNSRQIWRIVNTELWLRMFIDR